MDARFRSSSSAIPVVILTLVLAAFNPPPALYSQNWLSESIRKASTTILVDTHIDANDAGHQVCRNDIADDCSLRGAITHANHHPESIYTIQLLPVTYILTQPGASEDENLTGDLDIWVDLELVGAGSGTTFLDGNQTDRILDIQRGAMVSIADLQIVNGATPAGQPGGGILNAGALTMNHIKLATNHAGDGVPGDENHDGGKGGSGGGLYNSGQVSISSCDFVNNQAGAGGDAPGRNYDWLSAGNGGNGGAVYSVGEMEIVDSVIASNRAGNGGSGLLCWPSCSRDWGARGGQGGLGGGLANFGALSIQNTLFHQNQAGAGGNGGDGFLLGGYGGQGGEGGGIANLFWLKLLEVTLEYNRSGEGGFGGEGIYKAGYAGGGRPGHGGGLYTSRYAHIVGSQFYSNSTSPILQDYIRRIGDGGGIYTDQNSHTLITQSSVNSNFVSGGGGGIFNAGEMQIETVSLVANQARQQGGGLYNAGELAAYQLTIVNSQTGPGYNGYYPPSTFGNPYPTPYAGDTPDGGGIYNHGRAYLNQASILSNTAGRGGRGIAGNPGSPGGNGGRGGGIFTLGEMDLFDSIVDGNQAGQGNQGGENYDGQASVNGAGGSGGGIYNRCTLNLVFAQVSKNTTGSGFSEAEPGGSGGGVYNKGDLSIQNSTFQGNTSVQGGSGGGLYLSSDEAWGKPLTITSATVVSNTAAVDGGGVYLAGRQAQFDSMVLAANQVGLSGRGSGIFLADQLVNLRHLTIAGNYGGDGSGVFALAATVSITNTLIAGQTIGLYVGSTAIARLQNTLWGAGDWANQANWLVEGFLSAGMYFMADPLFENSGQLDYHLSASSPARDRGLITDASIDIDNQPRSDGLAGVPDLGADEVWNGTPVSSVSVSMPGVVTATFPIPLSAHIEPFNPTPYVSYLWWPEPQQGQWTSHPVYLFETGGIYTISVKVFNASGSVSTTIDVNVNPLIRTWFFPMIFR